MERRRSEGEEEVGEVVSFAACFVFCVLCFVFCVLCFVFCVLCFVFCVLCFVFCVVYHPLSVMSNPPSPKVKASVITIQTSRAPHPTTPFPTMDLELEFGADRVVVASCDFGELRFKGELPFS